MMCFVLISGRVQFVDMMQGPDGRPNGNAFVLFDRPEEASRSVGGYIRLRLRFKMYHLYLYIIITLYIPFCLYL